MKENQYLKDNLKENRKNKLKEVLR